ncbi:carboxypeptidase B-like protein, partial [Dinothrombium tinctorium]
MRQVGGFELNIYHNYEEIIEFLKHLTKHSKHLAIYSNIGRSTKGNEIGVVKISDGFEKEKPVVIIECGIHAREWVAVSTCLWIANDLVKHKPKLLGKYEFHLIPIVNPDGYIYTWNRNRYWRKNLSNHFNNSFSSQCFGADLNRNFDANFCESGASKNPCEQDFCGPFAFSEAESKVLRDYILKQKSKLKAYFALHNFGQFWMYPYAHSHKMPSNIDQLVKLSKLAVDTIKRSKGATYEQGQVAKLIMESSGSSIDWVYDNTACKIVFAIELRDKGQHGFRLPNALIEPTAIEAWS